MKKSKTNEFCRDFLPERCYGLNFLIRIFKNIEFLENSEFFGKNCSFWKNLEFFEKKIHFCLIFLNLDGKLECKKKFKDYMNPHF